MRGPIMSACVRGESGVGVARQEVSVHANLIGLSVSACLLTLPPVTLATVFCCAGRSGGRVAEVSSKTLRLGVNWVVVEEGARGVRPLPGPGF